MQSIHVDVERSIPVEEYGRAKIPDGLPLAEARDLIGRNPSMAFRRLHSPTVLVGGGDGTEAGGG